ncbi:Golgi-specific brefeldin A-resistance guanine nucleotide exchange factor 1 isoform X4 [Lingula anatina]|uniref:Golgi-specific brefeldin A-resistance guanine nucleotide exchange factor 1 isoform X4 n=1 Tax=Lingula anatina TaxID=7574 RepID=A0A1S3IAA3_LINAN|nr:Golgi-specific brefeldin A-resistance guanine nucleotide exchange factor 1 isoform X4 [Lingula anatina]|eukprot:XP_013395195.1 Golgi-specific brefeldin A-resistance guanine nucleotide exchange factor 1 isoform X4 [Lingula anatina]
MPCPKNGVYIIQGEITLLGTAMRRSSRWSSHSHQDDDQDPLLGGFSRLKEELNHVADLDELEPNVYLSPFLEVIRSEDTTGPITGLALTSINKFLSYGLLDPCCDTAPAAIENIADAVTHARFVGTDPGSDEVVLMKILHVLRTLLLTAAGAQLTNESVCEIMQSCFRICFEMRLSELLRKSAEHTLMDMVQLLFSRLPQFKEDAKWALGMKRLKMRAGVIETRYKKKRSPKTKRKRSAAQAVGGNQLAATTVPELDDSPKESGTEAVSDQAAPSVTATALEDEEAMFEQHATIATTPVAGGMNMVDIHEGFQEALEKDEQSANTQETQDYQYRPSTTGDITINIENVCDVPDAVEVREKGERVGGGGGIGGAGNVVQADKILATEIEQANREMEQANKPSCHAVVEGSDQESLVSDTASLQDVDYINPRGVRFTQQQVAKEGSGPLIPYGLPCVRELFRFLISLTNPLDRHNTDVMIHIGLSLLTIGLEAGADHIAHNSSLLLLVKDEMCRNLFSLLQTERLSLFAAAQRVCFLLFESMRSHLKFQLESYLIKLTEIITTESVRVSYEQKEIALESVVQLWRIPGLVTELYLNYDCDLVCSNLFEDLTKLLSKNAFPVQGLFTTHLLCLEALLTVVDYIELQCHSKVLTNSRSQDSLDGMVKPQGEEDYNHGASETPPAPPVSGYEVGQQLLQKEMEEICRKRSSVRPNRMKISPNIPTVEDINKTRTTKRLLQQGAELFNQNPSKGITFLQEQHLLSAPLQPGEVVQFLKTNPKLDKKMIGEYISKKKNHAVLEAFVKDFNFDDIRLDEALRMYLETFRLPGEAPVISYLLEHFAEHWHKSNGEPFANVDAAFTLAYAVIMLNTDQHNHNVKKQNVPMTVQEFKRNVSKVNGGEDFDQEMLEEIYTAIKGDEILLPEEHTGHVKENYMWKLLLKRGGSKDTAFIHCPTGSFDHELFTLIWGPTVAALSFVFDKSMDESIIQKAVSGFRKCAMISAYYGISDVFDNLVISLCKFTSLLSTSETAEHIPVTFGNNTKAQLAARTVFGLAHRHGDILREGWKNIIDCMLQLFRAKLLPEVFVKVEDFLDPSGRISLIKEETKDHGPESSVFSSLYSIFVTEQPNQKGPTPEEEQATKKAQNCIRECHTEQLIQDSKFLRIDSLQELIKALIFASNNALENPESIGLHCDDDVQHVFYLELLIKVVLQNRDRVAPIWQAVREHFYSLIVNASAHTFLVERAVVGLLRLAIRLLRREEVASQVLLSLRMLLMMKPEIIHSLCRQVTFGLHELLRTNAANIHSSEDWYTLFTLLEVAGAGASPPPVMQTGNGVDVAESLVDAGAQSDSEIGTDHVPSEYSDRGYTSDSELYEALQTKHQKASTEVDLNVRPSNGSWLVVNKEECERAMLVNQYSIELRDRLQPHDTKSLMKASESLAFLVRDAAHVTPHNFENCVHAIRMFVEASVNGGSHLNKHLLKPKVHEKKGHKHGQKKGDKMKKSKSSPAHIAHVTNSDDEEEFENTTGAYHSLSIQLLDLMHTLHTRAASIFGSWAEEEDGQGKDSIDAGSGTLWIKCWCPLLQGIARLCCDARRAVRSQALTYLQRALLVHDLQTLSPTEWESCFNKVLFPLLAKLLENICTQDPVGLEETRMRGSTLLCKVFLQHLNPLLSLPTFTALWLTILDYMDKYMHADKSDLLYEAIPESLKNMLLVMETARIFTPEEEESQLWKLTWDRIDSFLPTLRTELFKPPEEKKPTEQQTTPPEPQVIEHNSQAEPNTPLLQQQPAEQQQQQQQRMTTNGNVEHENGDVSHDLSSLKMNGTKRPSSTQRSKSDLSPQQVSGDLSQQNALMLMSSSQGLSPQQLQQLLQQQQQLLSGPQQVQMMQQQILQQQQSHKFHEQVLQQLNEQLQFNILQQSQLVQQQASAQGEKKPQNLKQIQSQLQQLAVQQQQLIQQIQMQQRQYLLAQGIGLPLHQFGVHPGMSPAELQQLWKEVSGQGHGTGNRDHNEDADTMLKNGTTNGLNQLLVSGGVPSSFPSFLPNGFNDPFLLAGGLLNPLKPDGGAAPGTHPLYGHGVCKWPGCDTPCDDFASFLKHINNEHQLDDRSTAQARVQMQVVSQLEIQLAKERERLQAMMQHLHMTPKQPPPLAPLQPPQVDSKHELPVSMALNLTPQSIPSPLQLKQPVVSVPNPLPVLTPPTRSPPTNSTPKQSAPTTPHTPQSMLSTPQNSRPSSAGPVRRRVSDKCNLPISAGTDQLDSVHSEIQRNREFYKNTDVRPPFTYASLIRQAIIDSPNKQLTLNEIYQWFTNTFSYFRRNEATWKNAVRHNLSLHKCFMRVENVKGAVWTVDEIEFYKRRPQKMSGNIQIKSPSLQNHPQLYGESLNASLRAALAESNFPLLSNSGSSMDEVEDLSISRQTSQNVDDTEGLATEPLSESEDSKKSEDKRPEYMAGNSPNDVSMEQAVYHGNAVYSQHGESIYHHGEPEDAGLGKPLLASPIRPKEEDGSERCGQYNGESSPLTRVSVEGTTVCHGSTMYTHHREAGYHHGDAEDAGMGKPRMVSMATPDEADMMRPLSNPSINSHSISGDT